MQNEKIVSVIIPTYKRADLLSKCVDSILGQTYSNIQVIVVDDNDPDTEWRSKTSILMDKYSNNKRVIYIKHDHNKNGAAARNTGFKASEGDFICFLDDDDIFLPIKIEKQVDFLLNNSRYDACCCDYKKEGRKYILESKEDYSTNILLSNDTPQTSGIMFRREAVESINGFDESYIRHQDYELLLRYFDAGYLMGKINRILYIRERAENNNLPNGKKMEAVKKKFLSQFKKKIETISLHEKNFKTRVYVVNYFTVMKCYLKDRNLKEAFRIMRKCIKADAILFIKEIFSRLFSSLRYRYYRKKAGFVKNVQ